jgi:hypothetical protein
MNVTAILLSINRRGSFRDIYDCAYVKTLPVYLEEGTCRVVAGNGYGKVEEMALIKHYYSEELAIYF